MWNQQIETDRTIPINKPDIIIRDNEKGASKLIDVAISGDRNVIEKEAEKIAIKYIHNLQVFNIIKPLAFNFLYTSTYTRNQSFISTS